MGKNNRTPSEHFVVGRLSRFCSPGNVMLDTAIGLAMSREHSSDISPELAEWKYAGNENHRELVLTFVTAAIVVYAARTGIDFNCDAFAYAALDAAYRVQFGARRGRGLVTAAERSKQARMRKDRFLDLRSEGEERLERGARKGLLNLMRTFEIESGEENVVELRPKNGDERHQAHVARVRTTNRYVGQSRAA